MHIRFAQDITRLLEQLIDHRSSQKYCGPDLTVITPIGSYYDEVIIEGALVIESPQNYLYPPWDYGFRDVYRIYANMYDKSQVL